jgi:hypothetical protein
MNGLGSLIDDVPLVLLPQHVLPDERIQVYVHVFEQDVDVFLIHGSDNLFRLDDVGVVEFFEIHDLSEGSLRIR